jgi:hypothetical protein
LVRASAVRQAALTTAARTPYRRRTATARPKAKPLVIPPTVEHKRRIKCNIIVAHETHGSRGRRERGPWDRERPARNRAGPRILNLWEAALTSLLPSALALGRP